ncbi:MAG: 23S rRNA (guanosine(2251)-2'-O)-methyltransferase RlmB [Candidatus Ancillula sp.]|jgi:23S rRNA (guanosine2251-2'-O)-methyltransferase|nr:23S rRNA (guanosine(2251)-2'-O)-methyltransferase RlmB [Candidatus Ancillula sp.]
MTRKSKGPTPKAEDRVYHKAHKEKLKREHQLASNPKLAKVKRAKAAGRINGRAGANRYSNRKDKKKSLEVIYGRNAVVEALENNIPASRLVFAIGIDHDDRTKKIMQIANEQGIQIYESSRSELDAITRLGSHQGVCIQIPHFNYSSLDELISGSGAKNRIVVLDHITDPNNLGAVARSAAAFEANIIIPENRSVEVNATVWKVSAGNLAKTKVCKVVNVNRALEKLKKAGYFVVGLAGEAELPLESKQAQNDKIAYVAGNEGKGMSKLTRETCDVLAKIDTCVESLNVATAVSIALYSNTQQVNF